MSELRTYAATARGSEIKSVLHADDAVAVAEPPRETTTRIITKSAAKPAEAAAVDPLVATILGEIRRLTRGGVRDLEVVIESEAIRLRGRCSTFYCKQLAQHAAMHWIGKSRLYNEIEVW